MTVKQVIVMRKDLQMRKGKMIAQGSHASMSFITRRLIDARYDFTDESTHVVALSDVECEWLDESFIKIVLYVNSEEELLAIKKAADNANVVCHLVQDDGRTEFNGVPTYTCLALGPDTTDRIDPITRHLELL